MCFRDRSSRSYNPRAATLNVPMNLARTRGAMVVDTGKITGVRNSSVEGRKMLVVNGKQVYYVEQRMAEAFGYGVDDKVKVYEHNNKYYFTATKGKKDAA
ncbi:hypothetical protein D3C85_747280 [compost metagenome]